MNKKQLINILPWWSMVSAKLVLSKIPNKHVVFRKLNLFKHGFMMEPSYAINVFNRYIDNVELKGNFTLLELGPGDSVSTAIIAYAKGASKTYLVDNGDYAAKDMSYYHNLVKEIPKQDCQRDISFLLECNDFKEMLNKINGVYLTSGLKSLKKMKSESVDYIFSNAVLEHIEKDDFKDTFKELHRINKKGGEMYHGVDLRDHIKYNLNSLRFSEKLWESNLFKNAGFYTNRLRYQDIIDIVTEYNFKILKTEKTKWNNLPIKISKLNPKFRNRKDLDVLGFSFIAKKL